jgi:hypothetical protein
MTSPQSTPSDMPSEYDYDLFVSFTGTDLAWARWIVAQLAATTHPDGRAFRILFQDQDFVAGANWVSMIHDGVERSERILAVLSPSYLLRSPFGTAEWQAIWPTDPNGLRRRLVPVRVRDCTPGGLLTAIVYIDLVHGDEQTRSAALHDGIYAAITGKFPRRGQPPFPA